MTIREKFKIGQPVFLIADPEQVCYQIVYITIDPNGLTYGIRMDGDLVDIYEDELTTEKIVI